MRGQETLKRLNSNNQLILLLKTLGWGIVLAGTGNKFVLIGNSYGPKRSSGFFMI